ncbi:Ribosomal protein S10 [Cynara cardunculus var. scolymus]|uniref:Ribosomal protein S10 n=1 Tax=Cynara cardunculus var. scolymus TaxID=59895 RepID=A0A103Y4F5_CYNCS|nr:Ribosomal protein S10 [Cynara cardunculus var. scolymus]
MAFSSSLAATLFPLCNSSSISSTPKLSGLPFLSNASSTSRVQFQSPRLSTTRVFSAPETLEQPLEIGDSESSTVIVGSDSDKIMDAARTTNAKTMGPVPLPTKKRIYCVLKSPHVHKDARFHFEIRTHQRLIDILHPTAQTIDSLMQLDLPAGVDVEVKL